MPMMTESGSRPEEIGEVLVKVNEDLLHLKEKILQQGDTNVDLSSLEGAIKKTQDALKSRADQVLSHINNRVMTLPNLDSQKPSSTPSVTAETTWDLKARTRPPQTGNTMQMVESREPAAMDVNRRPVPMKKSAETSVGSPDQMQGPSPGNQFRKQWHQRIVENPYNPKNREVLNENYGIQLPLIEDKNPQKAGGNQVIRGSTVEPLAVLPRANRIDPQLMPPQITEEDARFGILSLIERGLIPPAADLTLDPAPVRNKIIPLHDPKDREVSRVPPPSVNMENTYNIAGIRMDPNVRHNNSPAISPSPKPASGKFGPSPDRGNSVGTGRRASGSKLKTPVSIHTLEIQPLSKRHELTQLKPLEARPTIPPPTTPASGADHHSEKQHRFAIQNGKIRDTSQEFLTFKQHYVLSWGSIVTILHHMQRMLANYSVPVAFISGDKLADLAIEFELEKAPDIDDLLMAIVNRDDVEALINKPGQRFLGPDGRDLAASKVQATWKMYRERIEYLEYRRKKWAAGVIAISWVMNVKMAKVRKQLMATRADQLENFRRRAKIFSKNWDRMKNSPHVIIHLPSMGYTQTIRDKINDFSILQNLQMARLCDIKDPNVDVIYVSPVPINEEMQQYYDKLLGLRPAIDSGNVDDQGDVGGRYKIVVPEAIKSFPAHKLCLSTHLKYSPRTLKRLRNLIRGRQAYIVTGVPCKDDLHVADVLDVPLMCPEPEVAHLYSTKSGSKRIFASAGIAVPPGEYDVYSLPQLQECLAQLITENLDVTRWLLKLDDEFDGRGIAYIDVARHLQCYPWALKEAQRYGEKWSKKWAQEAAYIKIHAEIPEVLADHARPVNTTVFPTWQKFLEAFLSQGGIIEACPPSDSVTALSVDMFIEPNGKVNIESMGDQIHAETPFSCWGMSVPQSSVEPDALNECCMKVGEACKARGVIGHFTIDFVTFIHPKSMQQLLWAVDLNLSYGDSNAMFTLMRFATAGALDTNTHYFDIPPPNKEEKKTRRRKVKEDTETAPNTNRYAVMSTRLRHTNLSVVHYSVFFQMCRAHGIGYDIKEKQGTVFTLIDSFSRENLGMLTIGDSLQGALATFARNLSVIHQEISAPNMQGENNFKPVVEDIESILGTTLQNAEDQVTEAESNVATDNET